MKQIISLMVCAGSISCYALQADQIPDGAAPAAQPQAQAAAPSDVTEWNLVQGIETTDDEGRGDWFKKKRLVQQARKLYQDMHAGVEKITSGHESLRNAYAPQLKLLAEQFASFALQPEELTAKLQALDASIEALSAREKLTEAERKQLVDQQDSKNLLQQFVEDVTFAVELEKGLQEAVAIADTQVALCKSYEQKAWSLYESIDAALNDTIAEQMFEEMQTMAENIGLIGNYLAQDLNGYFQKSMPLLEEQNKKIAEQYSMLQTRGVLEKKLTAQELEAEKQKAAAAAQAKSSHSWWQWLVSPFTWLWNWIMSFFRK